MFCVVSSPGLRPKRKRAIICDASINILHQVSSDSRRESPGIASTDCKNSLAKIRYSDSRKMRARNKRACLKIPCSQAEIE